VWLSSAGYQVRRSAGGSAQGQHVLARRARKAASLDQWPPSPFSFAGVSPALSCHSCRCLRASPPLHVSSFVPWALVLVVVVWSTSIFSNSSSCKRARLRFVAHHHLNKEKPRGEVLAVQEAKAAEEWEVHWALVESPVPQQLVQYDLPKVNAQGGTPSLWSARDHDESLDNKVRVVSAHIIKAGEDDAKSVVTPLLLVRPVRLLRSRTPC
jgi:hypothetical protein